MPSLFYQKKSFESISVVELTKVANVARLTFYRHFEGKDSVLKYYFDTKFTEYYQALSIVEKNNFSLYVALNTCFKFWEQDLERILLLEKHGLSYIIYEVFNNHLKVILESNLFDFKLSHLHRKFIAGGLISILFDWSKSFPYNTSEQMTNVVLDLISDIYN